MVYITLIERKDIMKKKMGIKRWLFGVMVLFLCLPSMSMASQRTRIVFNGSELKLDTPAVVEQGTTLVPLRNVFEAFGAKTHWDAKTRSISATMGETTIWLQVNNKTAKVGSKEIRLDVPAKIKNGYTLVPLRFISEAFGVEPMWNAKTRTITIGGEEKAKSNEIKVTFSLDTGELSKNEKFLLDLASGHGEGKCYPQKITFDLTGSILEGKDISGYYISYSWEEGIDYTNYEVRKEIVYDSILYCGGWYKYNQGNTIYYKERYEDLPYKHFIVFSDQNENSVGFVVLDEIKKEGVVKGTAYLHEYVITPADYSF